MPFVCAYSDYNLVKFVALKPHPVPSSGPRPASSNCPCQNEIFSKQTIDNELIAIVAVWGHISTANKLIALCL